MVAVAPSPLLPPDAPEIPSLPESLAAEILSQADRHASRLGASIRQLLAQPNLTAGVEKFSSSLSGKELVHTSYFDHPDVIELLVANIICPVGGTGDLYGHGVSSGQLFRHRENEFWFAEFKSLLDSGKPPTDANRIDRRNLSPNGVDQQGAA